MSERKTYVLLFTLVGVWCCTLFLPPLIGDLGGPSIAWPFYRFFSLICHQIESRSIHALGYPLAVCARCSSVYLGFFSALAVSGLFRGFGPKNFRPWFAVVLLPMLIDVLLDEAGIHHSTMTTRVITGCIFGAGSGILLTPILVEALRFTLPQRTNDAKT